MPVAVAVAVGAVAAHSANQQAKAAKAAGKTQAEGVRNAQAIQQQYTDRAVAQLGGQYDMARQAVMEGGRQSGLLLDEAGNILSGGYDQARNDINSGFSNSDRLLTSGYGDAISTLTPTLQQGRKSSDLQAALSGALGSEAQKQAYANFNSSPGTQYLQKQQEQSILRNSAALGGGLGAQPEVMQALQENAFGLAQQDFSNSYARLSEISGRGDSAANSISNLQASLAGGRSGIQQQLAQILSGLSTGKAGAQAGIATDKANLAGATQQQIAQFLEGQGVNTSNAYMQSGAEQTQLAQNLGQANSAYNIYRANNASPLAQGITAGVGAYTGAGGGFGSMLSGGGGGAGATRAGYTGSAYQNWLNQQGRM